MFNQEVEVISVQQGPINNDSDLDMRSLGVKAVFKINIHSKIFGLEILQRMNADFEGVTSAKANSTTNEVTVAGKFDPQTVRTQLASMFNREVEVISVQQIYNDSDLYMLNE